MAKVLCLERSSSTVPWGPPLRCALLIMVAALLWRPVHGAFGDPFQPTCPFIDPPAEGWSLWSNASTWPSSRVPGLSPSAPENVVIPCGKAVLLDVPNLNLGLLNVSGHLMFLDSPSLPSISINATAIVVFGQLTIGTEAQAFSQRVNITLFSNATKETYVTGPLPATPNSPQTLGEKVFAVVGGQLNLHGMPGGSDTPSWVHLSATAKKGATSIQVDTDVSLWPVGAKILIASTDFDGTQAEPVVVTNITAGAVGGSVISFAPPLQYMHWGDDMESGVPGVKLFQKAEVALLTRNIYIQGQRESGPRNLTGGHFMVYMTQTPQYIEGLELAYLGQQGLLGRYPMHFHICGSHNSSYIRKLSIHDSIQRCLVVHATNDLLIEENVAFNVTGHCYMTEDGIEVNNTFKHNLAAVTNKPLILIPPDGSDPSNSDNLPALFWMTNANNTLVGNSATGSPNAGYWYQLFSAVRGVSKNLPGASSVLPKAVPILLFANNTAHSTGEGISTYEGGCSPAQTSHPASGVNLTTPTWNIISGANAYKNTNGYGSITRIWATKRSERRFSIRCCVSSSPFNDCNRPGIFVHNSNWVKIQGAILSDNGISAHMTGFNQELIDSVIVAESANFGNPTGCNTSLPANCYPVDTCTLPLNSTLPDGTYRARTFANPYLGFTAPTPWGQRVGVLLKENTGAVAPVARGPIVGTSVTFVGFTSRCNVAYSAIGVIAGAMSFDPGHTFSKLTFINSSLPVFFNPSETWGAAALKQLPNDAGWHHVFKDADGSLIGPSPIATVTPSLGTVSTREAVTTLASIQQPTASSPNPWGVGFVVSNSSHLLPLKNDTQATCLPEPTWNAYRCWGVCYRTLRVWFEEPGFTGSYKVTSNLIITRVADNASFITTGSLSPVQNGDTMLRNGVLTRAFAPNLPVGPGYTYTIQKVGGVRPDLDPSWIRFGFEDDSASCGVSSTVRVLTRSSNTTYSVVRSSDAFPFYKRCEQPMDATNDTFVSKYCGSSNAPVLEANLGVLARPNVGALINATLVPVKAGTCLQESACGLVAPRDTWQYSDAPMTVPFPNGTSSVNGALSGPTPIVSGYFQYIYPWNKAIPRTDVVPPTITASQPQTLYLWTTFTVANASCYKTASLGIMAQDGFAVYLNGAPIASQGLITNATAPLQYNTPASYIANPTWQSFNVTVRTNSGNVTGLVSGINTVAVEVHQAALGTLDDQVYFDFWLAANKTCG